MTDHEQGLCPRCGEPAGDYGFCEPCRSHIESLTWMPIREVMEALDSDDVAARAQRAVLRLEQALTAVSTAAVGQTNAIGVQVDSEPRAEGATGTSSIEATQSTRAVARFEDVMRIAPTPAPIAQTPAAPQTPAAAQTSAASQTSAAPEVPEARREVIRLELSPAPIDEVKPVVVEEVARVVEEVAPVVEEVEEAPAPAPAPAPMPAPVPASPLPPAAVAADPSAPFWFECLPTPPAPCESVAPPARESVPPPAGNAEPKPEPLLYTDRRFVHAGSDTSRRTWVAALCLLLLAGLVVVLTGRAPRR